MQLLYLVRLGGRDDTDDRRSGPPEDSIKVTPDLQSRSIVIIVTTIVTIIAVAVTVSVLTTGIFRPGEHVQGRRPRRDIVEGVTRAHV